MDPSTSDRIVHQYCSVCKAKLDMSVVSDAGDDGVIWLKCPRCKGILPHMDDGGADSSDTSDGAAESTEAASKEPQGSTSEASPTEEVVAAPDFNIDDARSYQPSEFYEIGDVIHHLGWDDYGIVTAKEELPGNRSAIRVRFNENGELQLIEGAS
jgi:hypothetical protein